MCRSATINRGFVHLLFGLAGLGSAGCHDLPEVTEPEVVPAGSPAPDFATAAGVWTRRASLPGRRWAHGAAVVPNSSGQTILYVFGGWSGNGGVEMKDVDAYNPATNAWTARADMPVRRREINMPTVLNGKIYVSGGVNTMGRASRTVVIYDPVTNTWARTADSLPEAMAHAESATLGGTIHLLYGYALYRYDASLHSWKRLANVPHDHYRGGAGVINGRWYVAGGGNPRYGQRFLDVYDPATNRWTAKAPMPVSDYPATGVVRNGKLYVIGERVQVYDPATNTWSTRTPMPVSRKEFAAGTITRSGKAVILVSGGYHERYAPKYSTDRVDEYSE